MYGLGFGVCGLGCSGIGLGIRDLHLDGQHGMVPVVASQLLIMILRAG